MELVCSVLTLLVGKPIPYTAYLFTARGQARCRTRWWREEKSNNGMQAACSSNNTVGIIHRQLGRCVKSRNQTRMLRCFRLYEKEVDKADRHILFMVGASNDFVLCSNSKRYALGCTCSSTASSAMSRFPAVDVCLSDCRLVLANLRCIRACGIPAH